MKPSAVAVVLLLALAGLFITKKLYYYSKAEELANVTLNRTAHSIKKTYGIRPSDANSSMLKDHIKQLTLCFDTDNYQTREELRILLIKCAQELLSEVNNNPDIQNFLVSKPFTIENINIRIHNQDKDGKEAYDTEISVAEISQGILTYKTGNDRSTLKNTFNETYDEAIETTFN